jgi:3-methylcrotonyl-CoA carboxylase alpha subunit
MFSKILIANRGEIACRVARTARKLGLRTVAVYSDADAHSAHVAACDEAVHIGGPRPQDSYLRGDAILDAARRTGAEAIHPGYGFLSENAEFAAACAAAGIVFIGPSPRAIEAMGSKAAAKSLMEKAGVPLMPGFHGESQDPAHLLAEARRIGLPVLIKAVAGGGGKGMRRVDRLEDFAGALASCQREAKASFKDDRVLLEKYVTPARHIEIQVFGDGRGDAVYLFERDCSVQRRHQKVIEEAPAPGMTPERRRAMGEAAVAAARAVDYAGAGTVEFIAAPDGQFFFMEMNTRLQVEHPVTEMITGLDLVEWQLRVASGEPLPLRQGEIALRGHAIEARIYAEDPAHDFLPSIGVLEHLSVPATSMRLRIDTGVREGDEITPYYDPMIAKLVVHADTRVAAVERMRVALAEFHVVGVRTNVEFLGRLMTAESFRQANLDTALIERERAHVLPPIEKPPPAAWTAAARAAIVRVRAAGGPATPGPWSSFDGWRLGGHSRRDVCLRTGDWERPETLDFAELRPNELSGPGYGVADRVVAGEEGIHVFLDGRHYTFAVVDPYLPAVESPDAHGGLVAPMPGRVLAVLVKAGETVERGAPLIVMEAMKMEHTIVAPTASVVDKLLCAVGEQVREGAELLILSAR